MKISHITCISNILTDLCFTKQRIKTKSTFTKVVYSVLVVKMWWQNINLTNNGAQSARLEKRTIESKTYFKQIPVPFKIYADFEYILKSVEGSYSKKYQDHVPCNFA